MVYGNFPMTRNKPLATRRRFLQTAAGYAAWSAAGSVFMPAISRAADRPNITHGVQSGDVDTAMGVVWARADRPSRMQVEIATTDSFKTVILKVWADALPETDLTAKIGIEGLPAGQEIFYRIAMQSHADPLIIGEPAVGRFRTGPADKRNVSFCWSGDAAKAGASMKRAAAC
jgi:alkaline phosphatase D